MKKSVVYIHGYNSKSKIFKSLDKIFNNINMKSFFFDYDSEDNLERILFNLDNFMKENEILNTKITFICHSLGGLILNKFLENKKFELNKIIYISTPIKSSLNHINKEFKQLCNQSFESNIDKSIFICSLLKEGQQSSFESFKHLNPFLESEQNDGVLTINEMRIDSDNFYTILGYDHFWVLFSKYLKIIIKENI